jgi:hypothetical protein
VHTLLLCITAIINDATPRTRSFKHAGRCFRCAVKAVWLFFLSTETRCRPLFLSLPRSMSSMSRILPYGSRGDVKSDDSHVRACTCIHPCTCFWYVGTFRSWMLVCHPTPSSHAMPYTDCLSLPLLSSLRCDRVGPMWNLSYITLLYESLGSALIRCRHRHLG